MVATGIARLRATLVGAVVRRDTALTLWDNLRQQRLQEMADKAELQQQMAQWRTHTARVMATIKVSATVTMAIVKLKMQWRLDRQAKRQWAAVNMRTAWPYLSMKCTQCTAGPVNVQHMGRLAAVATKRLTATMNMVAEISAAAKAEQKQRRHYERLSATYAMVEVRRVIRSIHNRKVENMREEMVQQHWDMYAAGQVTKEWEAQTPKVHWSYCPMHRSSTCCLKALATWDP